MASPGICKRKDGRWCGSLQVNGRRKYVYGKPRQEVKGKLEGLCRQVALTGSVPNAGKRTINDLLDTWLHHVSPNLKPRSGGRL